MRLPCMAHHRLFCTPVQLEHDVLPVVEYVPAAQNTHAARLVDPDTCEYVLSGHRTHCSTSMAP